MRRFLDDRRLILALYALGVALWPVAAGLEVTIEDGFYYFKIAENVVRGAGSTFDGRHPTNGYHPLWLLCLLPSAAASSTPAQALALGKLVQASMAALTAALLYRALRVLADRRGATVAVLLWIALTHRLWLQGLEYALHSLVLALALLVYLSRFRAAPPRSARHFLALGLCCALAFLARLDSALLAAVLGAGLLAASARAGLDRGAFRRLAVFALPVLIAGVAYVALNLHLFGHPLPVSAAVKRDWSQTLLQREAFYLQHGWLLEKARALLRPLKIGWGHPTLRPLALGITATCAWLAIAAAAWRWRTARRWLDALRPLWPWVCFSALSYLVYALSYHRALALIPRYYAVQPLVGAAIAGTIFDRLCGGSDRLPRPARIAVAAGPAVLLILLTAWSTRAWIRAETAGIGQPLVNAARRVARELPEETRIASWNPGTIAYLAGRQVVNLDGLVNSWDYFETERHDVCGYWRKERITHLVDLFHDGEDPKKVLPIAPIPIQVPCTENLELLWRDDRYESAWSVRAYRIRWTEGE